MSGKLKILVIGSGGREHALCWKLKQSPRVAKIFCAPGNAGTLEIAENVAIKAEDIHGLCKFVVEKKIGLTVVGPEAPLVAGIVDEFEKHGHKIFGPSAAAAMIEGSKAFAKEIMKSTGVPTARYEVITSIDEAQAVVSGFPNGAAVKADGLAGGKGVIICRTQPEILGSVNKLLQGKFFAGAGKRIVIEELLDGEEASILAFCDGKNAKLMLPSQDHKRINDNDEGENTGGMGAYAPTPIALGLEKDIHDRVFKPVLGELARRGTPYKGVLYAGLMINPADRSFKVLEFNCRFGDPEAQATLPLLDNDLVGIIEACIDGRIGNIALNWKKGAACCVILASRGYPGDYEKGKEILGLDKAKALGSALVFHAGTKQGDGKTVTSGGRVIGVTGIGVDIGKAIGNAYKAVEQIRFDGMHYRSDIGRKASNA